MFILKCFVFLSYIFLKFHDEINEIGENKQANENNNQIINCNIPRENEEKIQELDELSSIPGLSLFAKICIAICVIGSSFQYGWHIGVYNIPVKKIQLFFNETYERRYNESMSEETWTSLWSLTNAVNPAGGIIGGLMSGLVADYFGRKRALILINIFTLISGVLAIISKPFHLYETLIAGRFFAGLISGLFMGVAPLYLSEIPPLNSRGKIGSLNQLGLTIGIFVANILGMPQLLGTSTLWPVLVSFTLLPMFIQIIGLPFCVESPKYLFINKKNPEAAYKVLKKLRTVGSNIDDEIKTMKIEMETQIKECTYFDLLKNSTLRKALLITIVCQLINQLSGINAVMFYSTQIFISIGLDENTWAVYASLLLGFIGILMSFVVVILIEKSGRKILLVIGIFGMSFFSFALAISRIFSEAVPFLRYLSALSVFLYNFCFAIGPGPIPWLITGELFKSDSRGKASSIAVFVCFLSNFIVTLSFPFMESALGNYSFMVFGSLLILFGVFTLFKIPETKNKTVEQIWKEL